MSLQLRCKEAHNVSTCANPPESRTSQTSLAAIESLAVPLVQEVVFLADFRCRKCQKRVAEMLSKMNGEAQAVVIGVVDKKVTLTCTYPNVDPKLYLPRHRSLWRKACPVARLFCSYTEN